MNIGWSVIALFGLKHWIKVDRTTAPPVSRCRNDWNTSERGVEAVLSSSRRLRVCVGVRVYPNRSPPRRVILLASYHVSNGFFEQTSATPLGAIQQLFVSVTDPRLSLRARTHKNSTSFVGVHSSRFLINSAWAFGFYAYKTIKGGHYPLRKSSCILG